MANLKRSAKSASNWTTVELKAYNISISSESQHPEKFYGIPLPTITILSRDNPDIVQWNYDHFITFISQLDRPTSPQETRTKQGGSFVLDLTKHILDVLGYLRDTSGVLFSRHHMPLQICGDPNRSARSSVSLVLAPQGAVLLVAQTTANGPRPHDPEPQVIAEAIAAFQWDNRSRAQLGEPELDSMTIPCITMIGTRPTFYLVPVTRELSDAIATAQYPRSPTVVKKCVAELDGVQPSEGMENLAFRQSALQHFTAFRTLAKGHWSAFMVEVD